MVKRVDEKDLDSFLEIVYRAIMMVARWIEKYRSKKAPAK